MAAAGSTRTVFGYGTDLDWRPTTFVSPLPSSRLCSVCGLVPQTITALPCSHHICRQCFDSVISGMKRCPIDGETLESTDDVTWSTHSRDSVLELRVRCWNATNGCVAEDTASAMLDHFASACRFHSVKCPTCGASVLHRDISDHVSSGCCLSDVRRLGSTRLNTFEQRLSAKLDRTVTSVTERTEDAVRAQFAGHLSSVTSSIERQQILNDVVTRQLLASEYRKNLTSLKATIKDAVAQGCGRDTDTIPSAMAAVVTEEICDLAKELSTQPTLTGEGASKALMLLAATVFGDKNKALVRNPPTRIWKIDDWDDFTYVSHARGRQRRQDRFGPSYYLQGYLVVPRLCFYPRSGAIRYSPYIIEGLYDKFITAPTKASLVRFIDPSGFSTDMKFTGEFSWVKPDQEIMYRGSQVLYLGHVSVPINVVSLEDGGFIADDTACLEIYHE
ncbi:hypothetical protein MRX96_010731 [Rhipicephalus microplus]